MTCVCYFGSWASSHSFKLDIDKCLQEVLSEPESQRLCSTLIQKINDFLQGMVVMGKDYKYDTTPESFGQGNACLFCLVLPRSLSLPSSAS